MFAFVACPVALGQQSPRRGQLLPAAALGFAGAAAVGMIDGIARHAAADGTNTAMPRAPGFAQNNFLMLDVSDLANGRVTSLMHPADFTRRQPNRRITLAPRHESRRSAGRSHHLRAATGSDLNVMN